MPKHSKKATLQTRMYTFVALCLGIVSEIYLLFHLLKLGDKCNYFRSICQLTPQFILAKSKKQKSGRPLYDQPLRTFRFLIIKKSRILDYLFFNKSRISANKTSSLLGAGSSAGAGAGSSFLRCNEFIPLIAKKITVAIITKSTNV